jgi:drug/metabolite transporter (DMT)-like permease
MPIVLFMAGLARVGPSTASIASTVEPPFTVALAWIVFGETLGPLQLAGGAFVLSAVVLLQLRSASVVRDELDVERGGEGARELEDVLPAHASAA